MLGTGPCGLTCSKNDVGKNTGILRKNAEANSGNPALFGNFNADFKPSTSTSNNNQHKPLTDEVHQSFSEIVIGVNSAEGWEQERMTFSVLLEPNIAYEDLK